jgi:hypothetical protein
MAKITRKHQKLFASTAGGSEIAQFGSLAAAAPAFTTDPDTIQALSQYLGGWFDAVLAGNSPAIEDMNALFYLYAYQLAYIMQAGVPEWNTSTVYYIGSLASDGAGNVYVSLTDNNSGNALSVAANWRKFGNGALSGDVLIPVLGAYPYALTSALDGCTIEVDTSLAFTVGAGITLPAASDGLKFTIKDIGGQAGTSTKKIIVTPNGSNTIEGLNVAYNCESNYGSWTFLCKTNNWSII